MEQKVEGSTDAEEERKLAIRRFRGDFWFRIALSLTLYGLAAFLVWDRLPQGDWAHALAVAAIFGASMFIAEWISALVLKRKSRPWRWRRDPADADPRNQP